MLMPMVTLLGLVGNILAILVLHSPGVDMKVSQTIHCHHNHHYHCHHHRHHSIIIIVVIISCFAMIQENQNTHNLYFVYLPAPCIRPLLYKLFHLPAFLKTLCEDDCQNII